MREAELPEREPEILVVKEAVRQVLSGAQSGSGEKRSKVTLSEANQDLAPLRLAKPAILMRL